MSQTSFIEKYPQNKVSKISVKPYFNPKIPNMGLEAYGQVVFDNIFHEEPIICLEQHGVRRHITGLNEFAPELSELSSDEREAKIKQIRQIVSKLEKELASNVVDPADPDFWKKVKLLHPSNYEFWDKIMVRVSNNPLYLEPEKDPYDLIKLYAIENEGFSLIARSLEAANNMATPPKFYLDKMESTAATNTEVKKLRNRAGKELDTLFNKNQNKLYYVAKVLDPNSTQYKKTTPNDIIYDNMDKFINGELMEKDKRKTAERFINVCSQDMETLKLQAIVKDATQYKMIATKSDGFIYHLSTSQLMGRTPSDAVEFLKNPLNEDVLKEIQASVEQNWNL